MDDGRGVLVGAVGLVFLVGCGVASQPEPLAARFPRLDSGQAGSTIHADAGLPNRPDADAEAGDVGRARDAGPAEPDGAPPDAGSTNSPLASTVVAENADTINTLAIDGATLYWLTNEEAVWVLDTATTEKRLLAQDATPLAYDSCGLDLRLAISARYAFWLAESMDAAGNPLTVLHRTERNGSGDAVIATGLDSALYPRVVADDTRVCWIEEADFPPGPGGLVRMLPADTAPGASPTTLVPGTGAYTITRIALADSTLYWVSMFDYTTAYRPALYGEPVSDLLAPQPPAPTDLGQSGWVFPHNGDLYVEAILNPSQEDLARRSPDGSILKLAPIDFAENIVFLDDWALVSVPSGGCKSIQYQLIAVSTAAAGGPVIPLADGLRLPAVLGAELAFVDHLGRVQVSTLNQIRAALATASR